MVPSWFIFLVVIGSVIGSPYLYETSKYRVGIEYDLVNPSWMPSGGLKTPLPKPTTGIDSLPMHGGSDRFRHRNNYDPFFVTVTATAKKGFVISYLEVSATVDASAEVYFSVIRGQTGSRTMTFQLMSNHSELLQYNYLAYGLREEEYKKVTNIITLPMYNNGFRIYCNGIMTATFILAYSLLLFYS